MEVLLEGLLEKCISLEHPKREWKKRYFVLKHLLASNVRCLEYYKDKNWKKHEPKGVLTLHSGYEVVKVDDPKRKHAFDIRTIEHTFRLCADSDTELNKWITILQENNIVRSFNVISQATLNFQRLGINGPCILRISYTEIQLVSSDTRFQVVAWPLKCLRRYSSMGDEFIIEAGRKAPTGEGTFVFHSTESDVIFSLLDNLIRSKAGQTMVPQTTALQPPAQNTYNHIKRPLIKQDSNPANSGKPVVQHDSNYDSAYSHLKGTSTHTPSTTLPPPPAELVQEDSYDMLNFDKRLSQLSNGSQLSTDLEDSYNMLQHDDVLKRRSIECTDPPSLEDTYDTLVHGMSPSQFQISDSASEDTYDKLNSPATTPPVSRKTKQVTTSKSVPLSTGGISNDSYNMLNHRVISSKGTEADNSHDDYSALCHTSSSNKSKKGIQPPIPRRRTLSGGSKGLRAPPIPVARPGRHQSVKPNIDTEDNYDVICANSPKNSKDEFTKCPLSIPGDETYDVIGQDTTLKAMTLLNEDDYDTISRSDSGGVHPMMDDNYSAINYGTVKPQIPPPLPKQRVDGNNSEPSSPNKHRNSTPGCGQSKAPQQTSGGGGAACLQSDFLSQLKKTLETGSHAAGILPEPRNVKKKVPPKPVRKC